MTAHIFFVVMLVLGLFAGILSGVPAMLAIAGVPLLVAVIASLFGAFDLGFLAFFPSRVWGVMTNGLLMAVPLFVLMGVVLERSRLAENMLSVLRDMLGSSARGLALSVLLFSAMIAASTGIIGATVVMLGLVALPAMLNAGISARLSSGLICASGTLGQIIPPSIVLVLLGDQIGNAYMEAQQRAGNFAPDPVSVGDLFAGALLPGLMLVGLYAIYVLFSLRPGMNAAPAGMAAGRPTAAAVAGTFLPPLLLILAVLGSVLGGVATTTEAAGVGAAGAILLAAWSNGGSSRVERGLLVGAAAGALTLVVLRSLSLVPAAGASLQGMAALASSLLLAAGFFTAAWRLNRAGLLLPSIVETLKISGMVFGIIIAASMLSLVFRGFGGEEMVEALMEGVPGGKWGALAIVMLVVFVLGFILEAVEIIYIVVPLLGPPILGSDFSPVWFAVLIALNLQTSFLTPPFGFALFYYRSVAPRSISTVEIYRSIVPFVAIQVIAVILVVIFPRIATWFPDLLFR